MLNYIWLSLIVLGTGVAVWSDWRDSATDRYRNGVGVECALAPGSGATIGESSDKQTLSIAREAWAAAYVDTIPADLVFTVRFTGEPDRAEALPPAGAPVEVALGPAAPPLWNDIAKGQKGKGTIRATLRSTPDGGLLLTPDPVRLVRLSAVTTDGIVRYAKTAVELAIGLIGIMALWLGLMKIAEQAGLVGMLSRLLRPATTRLFPDVPAEHPAMGAMLMNISANMLGLANAATPLGLKAMEELNRLTKKVGTATDAMCTFLVINTSSVQLIPATVIAIRAASGSTNPTEIVGPVIVATAINTVVGITAVRLLSKLPFFRRQAAPEASS